MAKRITNYYIGIQLGIVIIGWLTEGASHSGITFSNIYTQALSVVSFILLLNSITLYTYLYIRIGNLKLKKCLFFTLTFAGLTFLLGFIASIKDGYIIFNIPYYIVCVFGLTYSLILLYRLNEKVVQRLK